MIMASISSKIIRNIALWDMERPGKLRWPIPFSLKGKAVERRGSVDGRSSPSDYRDEEELKRRFSIDTTILHLEHHKQDAFWTAPAIRICRRRDRTSQAVETAVIVISAPNGIEVNTRRMFSEAGRRGLARMLVINKMDADNIHFDALVNSLQETFGKGCVLFNLRRPRPQSAALSASESARQAAGGCLVDLAQARSSSSMPSWNATYALMEKYLIEGTVNAQELSAVIPKQLAAGTASRFFALRQEGLGRGRAARCLCQDACRPLLPSLAPSPKARRPGEGNRSRTQRIRRILGASVKVITTSSWHLSFIRIFFGQSERRPPLVNAARASRRGRRASFKCKASSRSRSPKRSRATSGRGQG